MTKRMHADHKWLVIGDIVDQGSTEAEEHKKLAGLIADVEPEKVILVGRRTKKYTAPELLHMAKSMGLTFIDVPQGYARCSCLPVDETSIITADRGIIGPCRAAGLSVLEVTPGQVLLPGYTYPSIRCPKSFHILYRQTV